MVECILRDLSASQLYVDDKLARQASHGLLRGYVAQLTGIGSKVAGHLSTGQDTAISPGRGVAASLPLRPLGVR